MTVTPLRDSEGALTVQVHCDGQALPDAAQIVSLSVRRAVGSVASARLVLADGEMPTGEWALADAESFKPGATVRIAAGYGEEVQPLFEGLVIRLSARIAGANESQIVVECRDKAVKMALGRRNAQHLKQTDSQVITKIAQAHGLAIDIEATSLEHAALVQHYCSDWDFVMSRAELAGLLVLTDNGKLVVRAPDTSAAAALKVQWGEDLIEFRADLDASRQLQSVQTVAWDPKEQTIVSASSAPERLNAQGNLDSATLAKVMSPAEYRLQSPVPLARAELAAWGQAQQRRAGLARIRGRMTFQGSHLAVPGKLIEVAGVGKRYNGQVFVGAVEHELGEGNWHTSAEFGIAEEWFTERADVMAPAASGLVPGIEGLHIGVVMKLDADPAGEHRIQVRLPVLEMDNEGVWARLLQQHASKGFGAWLVPEIGDEVVVGFFNHDPTHPVVLGALYSSAHAPAYSLEAENNTKAWVTRSKHKLIFDEKDKVVTLVTPAGNSVVLSDKDKSIVLHDQNGNEVRLDPSGIVLDSPKDVVLRAKGNIAITALGAVSLSAQADASLKGLNVTCEAQVAMAAKGSATAELSAAGQTTVKGAMVMIN